MEIDLLTSGVEVALHGCRRATAGPQKKPCSRKHPVDAGHLHLHLVRSASGSSSAFAPSFIQSRGYIHHGVEVWLFRLAAEGVSGAIHWE